MNQAMIDTGDVVLHEPTSETWIVAYVHGEHLSWCGWPEGEALLSDCKLLKKSTPKQRLELLRDIAQIGGNDRRGRYARAQLEREGLPMIDPETQHNSAGLDSAVPSEAA